MKYSACVLFFFYTSLQTIPLIFFIPPFGSCDGGSFYAAFKEVAQYNGFTVELGTYDDDFSYADYVIVCHVPFNKEQNEKLASKKVLAILTEPPAVFPQNYDRKKHKGFTKVMTYNDDLVDNKKYFKLLHPQTETSIRSIALPFHHKKLCVMIAANKNSCHLSALYKNRREIVRNFEKICSTEFDVFGAEWTSPCHKKSTLPKHEILANYKFCICYENSKMKGYITEKIFDVMAAECVPIYYGAPNITDYVPSNCFIDRRKFKSDEELYKFIKKMPEKKYTEYIHAIRNFMARYGPLHNEYTFVKRALHLLVS